MAKSIRCPCGGTSGCKLCQGTGSYRYEPGPRGWMPIPCPTCEGARTILDSTLPEGSRVCITCRGKGTVDPANPPGEGIWDTLCKIFLGA